MNFIRLAISLFVLSFVSKICAQELTVTDIQWDKENSKLHYTLSKDSFVKIRIGEEGRVLYQTLVNLEKRPAGKNEEEWSGKGDSQKINLGEIKNLHFCVTAFNSGDFKDLRLMVSLDKDKLTIDLGRQDKIRFMQNGAELKVYSDGELIKTERIESLPYKWTISQDLFQGRHLVSLNLWQRPDYKSCAYANIESGGQKEISPTQKDDALTGKIAFCQFDKGYWQIWIADLEGRKGQILTQSKVDKRYPAFSPDGRKIAYVTNTGELWIMDSDGKNNRRVELPINCYEPKWSPDAKKLVFTSYEDLFHSSSKLWILDLETQELKKIAPRPFLQYNPNWAPDGEGIIFVDGPELYAQEIKKLSLKTNDVWQLSSSTMYIYEAQPNYLANGSGLVYASNADGDYDIWLIKPLGSEPRNLTKTHTHETNPVASSDSKTIYFLSDRSGANEIWQIKIGGSGLRQITSSGKDKRDITVWTN
jgi:TolB protein